MGEAVTLVHFLKGTLNVAWLAAARCAVVLSVVAPAVVLLVIMIGQLRVISMAVCVTVET